jgi:hypothetical protein
MINANGLLYIEPKNKASETPVIDGYTRRMAAALNKAVIGGWDGGSSERSWRTGDGWRGFHLCVCGAVSSSHDFLLSNGLVTNSLCVHYLARHRDEVPESELAKVMQLPDEEMEPTEAQVSPPGLKRVRTNKAARGASSLNDLPSKMAQEIADEVDADILAELEEEVRRG